MRIDRSPVIVAVPEVETYQASTGMGRVFRSLSDRWGMHVRLVDATLERPGLPILRNFPVGLHPPKDTDVVLLPRLTGAAALRNTYGIPSLVIVHDIGVLDFPGDRAEMDSLTYHSIRRSFYGLRHASQIATDSEFTRSRLLERLPEVMDRVTTIPAGVDESFLAYNLPRPESRQMIESLIKRQLGSPLLIYVGSEVPRKNIPLLLQVFRQIKDRHPGAQLLKVGGPGQPRWRAKTLRLASELGLLRDGLLILENIDDATLAAAYRAADVFASASLYEGFGLPALEALAVGTPVVVTNRGSFPEIVGDAGRVVAPELEPFAEAVESALADRLRVERSLKGRAHAATFSWARAAERYLEVLGGMCGRTAT